MAIKKDGDILYADDFNAKQDALVSGTNIKTINNQSILGSGNIEIQGGSTVIIDDALSSTSINPVQNKVINGALGEKQDNLKLKNSSTDNVLMTINPASTSVQIFDIGMPDSVISMDGVSKNISLTAGSTNLFIHDTTGISVNSKKITGASAPTEDNDVTNKKYVDDNISTKQDTLGLKTNVNTSEELVLSPTSDPDTFTLMGGGGVINMWKDSTSHNIKLNADASNSITLDSTSGVSLKGKTISASTDNYSITWDSTNEAIKITFK